MPCNAIRSYPWLNGENRFRFYWQFEWIEIIKIRQFHHVNGDYLKDHLISSSAPLIPYRSLLMRVACISSNISSLSLSVRFVSRSLRSRDDSMQSTYTQFVCRCADEWVCATLCILCTMIELSQQSSCIDPKLVKVIYFFCVFFQNRY